MNKVNIAFLAEHHRKMSKVNPLEFIFGSLGDDLMGEVDQIEGYIDSVCEKSRSVVISKVKEEEFVRALRAVTATITTSMQIQGKVGVTEFLQSGYSEEFIHTIVFCVVGMLIEEEVL